MREILFRGMRVDGKGWAYGIPVNYGDGVFILTDGISMKAGEAMFAKNHEVISETIGQFTGLLDKNGKKIFEYDQFMTKSGIATILWDGEKSIGLRLQFKNGMVNIIKRNALSYAEVIGNIHEEAI